MKTIYAAFADGTPFTLEGVGDDVELDPSVTLLDKAAYDAAVALRASQDDSAAAEAAAAESSTRTKLYALGFTAAEVSRILRTPVEG